MEYSSFNRSRVVLSVAPSVSSLTDFTLLFRQCEEVYKLVLLVSTNQIVPFCQTRAVRTMKDVLKKFGRIALES